MNLAEIEGLKVEEDELLVLRLPITNRDEFERWTQEFRKMAPLFTNRILFIGPGAEVVGVVKK